MDTPEDCDVCEIRTSRQSFNAQAALAALLLGNVVRAWTHWAGTCKARLSVGQGKLPWL